MTYVSCFYHAFAGAEQVVLSVFFSIAPCYSENIKKNKKYIYTQFDLDTAHWLKILAILVLWSNYIIIVPVLSGGDCCQQDL